jgi:hypothetical protein
MRLVIPNPAMRDEGSPNRRTESTNVVSVINEFFGDPSLALGMTTLSY